MALNPAYGQPQHTNFKVVYQNYGTSSMANSYAASVPPALGAVAVINYSSKGYAVIAYPSSFYPPSLNKPDWWSTSASKGSLGQGSGTGGGVGTSSAGTSGGALSAVQANQPVITGGGGGFAVGGTQTQMVQSERGAEFTGVDMFLPDEKLPSGKSPHAINWNALEKPGSFCVRKGLGRIVDDRTTVLDEGGSAINAASGGISLVNIDLNDPSLANATNTAALLLVYSTAAVTGTAALNIGLVEPSLAWGKLVNLISHPGPEFGLTSPASGTLRVTADYTNAFATDGVPQTSVKAITIAYSTTAFPRDPDGKDARPAGETSTGKTVVVFVSRTSWDGLSVVHDITGLDVTLAYYVTVWAHTLEGTSEPTFRRMQLT